MIDQRPPHPKPDRTGQSVTDATFAAAIAENDERLRALAYHVLGSRDAMDDVLQEVYLKAHRRLASFRGECSLSTWLYRIALTTCLDALRQQRRTHALNRGAIVATLADHATIDEGLALRDQLHRALRSLPPERCAAVLLVLRDGHTYAEAADILGVPPGTVASRVALGRKQLIQHLSVDAERGEQP